MTKVLVAYTTKFGSTSEVAAVIGEGLKGGGVAADVRLLSEIEDLGAYDAVVVGGPMIIGWHRAAVRFLKDNQVALSRKPVALFMTAMALTKAGESRVQDVPVFQDPGAARAPKNPDRLGIHESFSTPSRYVGPVLKKVPAVRPVAVALFGGKLDYSKLNPLQLLFIKVAIRAKEGDLRNWEAIRSWTSDVAPLLKTADRAPQ